ncbi:MAG: cytochrome P450 [Steroidobacteraceae bacterium]|nr:cytochrome P450 [Steroidobacteraceae bacterium]
MNAAAGGAGEGPGIATPGAAPAAGCPVATFRALAERNGAPDARPDSGRPIWRCPESGVWVVESYALIVDAVNRPAEFSNKYSLSLLDADFPAAEVERIYREGGCLWARTLSANDPPDHRRFRALVERIFSGAKVAAIEPFVRETSRDLLAAWPDGADFEAMAGYAVPLPTRVIARELGVAPEDGPRFNRWSDAAVGTLSLNSTRDSHLEAARAGVEFQAYFGARLDDPRLRPTGSLIDLVARAATDADPEQGLPITRAEQLGLLHTLMIAGHETTAATLGEMLRRLATAPATWDALRASEAVQKRYVEEMLRLAAPAQGLWRVTTREVELGGQVLPKRSVVSLRFAAANREAPRFPDPEAVRLDRPAVPAHLTFGAGIHHCIGAGLARRELLVALQDLLASFHALELAVPESALRYTRSVTTRGLVALPLRARRA